MSKEGAHSEDVQCKKMPQYTYVTRKAGILAKVKSAFYYI